MNEFKSKKKSSIISLTFIKLSFFFYIKPVSNKKLNNKTDFFLVTRPNLTFHFVYLAQLITHIMIECFINNVYSFSPFLNINIYLRKMSEIHQIIVDLFNLRKL